VTAYSRRASGGHRGSARTLNAVQDRRSPPRN